MNIDNLTYMSSGNVKVYHEPMSEAAEAIAKKNITKDLMYIKFELLHANTNRNSDTFLEKEVANAYKTLIDKPINWEHRPSEIIGHIYDSHYVKYDDSVAEGSKVDTNTDVVICEGVIYKSKVPQRAMEIQARYQTNDLFFSMETFFESAECSECGKKFGLESQYCEHLQARYQIGNEYHRILHGLLFSGAGCVENPADDAKGLLVASNKNMLVRQLIDIFGSNFAPEEYVNFMIKMKG